MNNRFLFYRECLKLDKADRKYYATPTITTTFADGNVLTAAQLNNQFTNLLNALGIVNADIAAGANIATSKINATFPTGAILGTTDTQTVSGKTIQGQTQTIVTSTPGAGGTATLDLSTGNLQYITMPAGNITIALSNVLTGKAFVVAITQDSGGSRTVTWFSTIRWSTGTTPTLTTTGNKRDMFGFIATSANTFDGFVVGLAV